MQNPNSLMNRGFLYIIKNDGKLQTGAIMNAAAIFNTCTSTIYKLWKRYGDTCDGHGLGWDYQQNYTKVGRKKNAHPNLLETFKKIPDDDRRTIRGAACDSGIPKSALAWIMDSNVLHKQNIHCKPFLKELNKVRRVEFILKHISHERFFYDFYSEVHINDKWFYLHKVKRGIILHPDEPKRVQKCQSKRVVTKVMFMATVARPRYDHHKKSWFNRLIGIFPFTEFKEAKRTSYRRKKETMEQVPITRVTNLEHEQMLVLTR